jgi:predicted nucleic acid-binding protein
MRRVLLDTNVYISFMNLGSHESLVLGPGLVRHMSTVVLMELETGATTPAARRAVGQLARAFDRAGRLLPPSNAAWKRAGRVLRTLRSRGREIRHASLVHDVLIALTARDIGATVITNDASDYAAIRRLIDFSFAIA